jgi:plasmid stability protein
MTTLMIRNLDPEIKRQLRKLAAEHGVSMEQEARDALARGVATDRPRRKPLIEELTRLGVKPDKPFDLKKVSDEMWEEGLRR